jgi:hypothetical protein
MKNKIPEPQSPLEKGDKVSVWRNSEARFRWGRVEKVIKVEGARRVLVKMVDPPDLGTIRVLPERITHRCVLKGCPRPARDGVKGHECAHHRAEATALRPTGRMDEFPRDAELGKESAINANGQHIVEWTNSGCNFHFIVRDKRIKLRPDQNKAKAHVRFYGWYRRSRLGDGQPVHSVDVFCKRMLDNGSEADVSVDTITYHADPRENIKSLEADLCAIAQRWLSTKVNGDVRSIDQLTQEAKKPKIGIRRLQTIDHLILKLKEIRDTAITAGGTRFIELEGDVRGGPTVLIELNVTPQALAISEKKGRPPSLYVGSMYDRVRDGKKGERIDPLSLKPDKANVQALQTKLQEARDSGDKATQRKLRAILRKMGHKGGTRQAK